MKAALSFLHISLPKLVEDNIPSSYSIQQMTLLKVESFQQFYFPFFSEENTRLELLQTIHKGKEANHPNFRDRHIPDSNRELPLLCRMGCIYLHVDLHMEYFKIFCFADDIQQCTFLKVNAQDRINVCLLKQIKHSCLMYYAKPAETLQQLWVSS